MVQLALILPPEPDDRWQLAKQIGVTNAVVHPLEVGDGRTNWTYDELKGMANWFVEVGIDLSVIEGSVPLTDRVRLGLEGRDEDINEFKEFLRDCGEVGIPVVCYDWMAAVRWARTEVHVKTRGDAYTTGYTDERMSGGPEIGPSDVTHEQLWEALEHFLTEVVPVAEEAGVKLGLHPADPPIESVRGIPRLANSITAYDRILEIVDSEHNGVTFCQGNFAAMGVDVPEAIRHFGERINFVHFRDIDGDAKNFVETWHDDGPMRPDHVPTMAGEDNSNPGYHTMGRLFAIGYMRGLLEQTTTNREGSEGHKEKVDSDMIDN